MGVVIAITHDTEVTADVVDLDLTGYALCASVDTEQTPVGDYINTLIRVTCGDRWIRSPIRYDVDIYGQPVSPEPIIVDWGGGRYTAIRETERWSLRVQGGTHRDGPNSGTFDPYVACMENPTIRIYRYVNEAISSEQYSSHIKRNALNELRISHPVAALSIATGSRADLSWLSIGQIDRANQTDKRGSISSLDLTGVSELTGLFLSRTALDHKNIQGLSTLHNLRFIELEENAISDTINLSSLSRLQTLSIINNLNIPELPQTLEGLIASPVLKYISFGRYTMMKACGWNAFYESLPTAVESETNSPSFYIYGSPEAPYKDVEYSKLSIARAKGWKPRYTHGEGSRDIPERGDRCANPAYRLSLLPASARGRVKVLNEGITLDDIPVGTIIRLGIEQEELWFVSKYSSRSMTIVIEPGSIHQKTLELSRMF